MSDQMNPDDLEAAAGFAERQIPSDDIEADNLRALAKAARYLAHVLDLADDVIAYHAGHVSTHYEDCYRHHAACLAGVIRDMDD